MTALGFVLLAAWAVGSATRRRRRRPVLGAVRSAGRAAPLRVVDELLARLRDGRKPDVGLPEAADAIAAAVGAGRSIVDGLAIAADSSPPALAAELDEVVAAVRWGLPVLVAVEQWAERSTVEGVRLVATAIGLAADAGGDVEPALAGVATTLRERRALSREIRALSSQARASATTITVAPIGFGALAVLADADTARFLLATPAGAICLAAGLALDLTGFRWMHRLAGAVR